MEVCNLIASDADVTANVLWVGGVRGDWPGLGGWSEAVVMKACEVGHGVGVGWSGMGRACCV